ncbi:MAG TPA: dihydroorotase family protein [Baekduia sp.]|nr:dihydroorotase family protein [Baekduia sp.]
MSVAPDVEAMDLGIEGGVVVNASGRVRGNVYVRDGRIAAVTPERLPARERVDADGLLVLPGMVDAHVHLMDPGDPEREDFPTGTAAAARAGVTTIIEHTHGWPVRSVADLEEKRAHLTARSRVDFALGAHAWPDRLDEIGPLWRAGVAFVKAFTCTTHGVPGFDPAHLRGLFERVAAAGAVCLLHCEDESLTAEAERELRATGRADGGVIPAWRNRDAELTATGTVALLAARTGARAVIAHVSNPDVLELVAQARARGAQLAVESCPQYLTLLEEEALEHGPFRKFTPPARARSPRDLERMWDALASGSIDYMSTDHAPSTREQKRSGSIWDVHFGLPGIDTTLAVLLTAAFDGRLALERVVEAYALMPARIYGLHPAKGHVAPGADADLVLVDPTARWTVRDEDVLSKAGWSPYAGQTLAARPVRTYLRGRLVSDGDHVVGEPGSGRMLNGAGAPPAR